MLQTKIARAEAAIESSLNIAKGCQKHYCAHLKFTGFKDSKNFLSSYISNMSQHRNCLKNLDRRLHNTLNLVRLIAMKQVAFFTDIIPKLSRMIMLHNEKLLQESNRASCQALQALLNITNQGQAQQTTLTSLAINGQATSVMLKSLSVAATIYLPASLIAVSKSTTSLSTITSLNNTRQYFHLILCKR